MKIMMSSLCLLVCILAGCESLDFWQPPESTPQEYDRGLVILYPGSSNLHLEMVGFYTALKKSGIDLAIEVHPWGTFMESSSNLAHIPNDLQAQFKERARVEALRLAEYIRAHPDVPVTLLTFSGGAVFALDVGAALPDDTPVDRIIVMSPGVWTGFDVAPTLDHVRQDVISYYSDNEGGVYLVATTFGTADGYFTDPAAALGFQYQDPRLIQVPWTPDMARLGNGGGHLDYFLDTPFIQKYVVPWIITQRPDGQ
jgi:pimeloyl-ACP methyl ester carboxylesterase